MTPSGPLMGDWLSVAAFIDLHAREDRKPIYLLAGADGKASGLLTLQDLAAGPVGDRFTTSVRTFARPVADLPGVQVGEPAVELIKVLGSAPLAVVWDGSIPAGTVTMSQLNGAATTAKLLASLRGEKQPAA